MDDRPHPCSFACPGRYLPAALACSAAQARRLGRLLPPADSQHLCIAALAVPGSERRADALPPEVVQHILFLSTSVTRICTLPYCKTSPACSFWLQLVCVSYRGCAQPQDNWQKVHNDAAFNLDAVSALLKAGTDMRARTNKCVTPRRLALRHPPSPERLTAAALLAAPGPAGAVLADMCYAANDVDMARQLVPGSDSGPVGLAVGAPPARQPLPRGSHPARPAWVAPCPPPWPAPPTRPASWCGACRRWMSSACAPSCCAWGSCSDAAEHRSTGRWSCRPASCGASWVPSSKLVEHCYFCILWLPAPGRCCASARPHPLHIPCIVVHSKL